MPLLKYQVIIEPEIGERLNSLGPVIWNVLDRPLIHVSTKIRYSFKLFRNAKSFSNLCSGKLIKFPSSGYHTFFVFDKTSAVTIEDWATSTFDGFNDDIRGIFYGYELYTVYFKSEIDAVLFKLKWG